jgi:DNA-binding protein YbaB
MLDKMKELYELKKQADPMKKVLEAEIIEVESGDMKVVISGDQKIKEIHLGDSVDEDSLKEIINKALEESQKVAAKKMQDMMGGMGGLANMLKS